LQDRSEIDLRRLARAAPARLFGSPRGIRHYAKPPRDSKSHLKNGAANVLKIQMPCGFVAEISAAAGVAHGFCVAT
jgi:hypothetical protein